MKRFVSIWFFFLYAISAFGASTELPDQRTYFQKEFDNGNGTHTTKAYGTPIHYVANGNLADIKDTLYPIDSGWGDTIENGKMYLPKWSDSTATFRDQYDSKNYLVAWKPVCNHIAGKLVKDSIIYIDAFGKGRDLIYTFYGCGMTKLVRFNPGYYPGADTVLKFQITFPADSIYSCVSSTAITPSDRVNAASAVTNLTLGKTMFIGHKKYTMIMPFHIWTNDEKPRDSLIAASLTNIAGKNYINKTVHKTFFSGLSTQTVYTDATNNYYSSNDGRLYNDITRTSPAHSWSDCVTGAVSGFGGTPGTTLNMECDAAANEWTVIHGYLTFIDSIPTGDNISSAVINITASTKSGAGLKVGLYSCGTYTLGNNLATWQAAGSTKNSDSLITQANWPSVNTAMTYTLNSTGITAIPKGNAQKAYFCLRDSAYDVSVTAPANGVNYVQAYMSSSATYKPYIAITHAPASTGVHKKRPPITTYYGYKGY